jgi:hypothetical protein
MSYSGQPLKRLEDPRLVTGNGSFVDGIRLPDILYAGVLRSPYAHARIRSIDVAAAGLLPGVVAVLTGGGPACSRRGRQPPPGTGGWSVTAGLPPPRGLMAFPGSRSLRCRPGLQHDGAETHPMV